MEGDSLLHLGVRLLLVSLVLASSLREREQGGRSVAVSGSEGNGRNSFRYYARQLEASGEGRKPGVRPLEAIGVECYRGAAGRPSLFFLEPGRSAAWFGSGGVPASSPGLGCELRPPLAPGRVRWRFGRPPLAGRAAGTVTGHGKEKERKREIEGEEMGGSFVAAAARSSAAEPPRGEVGGGPDRRHQSSPISGETGEVGEKKRDAGRWAVLILGPVGPVRELFWGCILGFVLGRK